MGQLTLGLTGGIGSGKSVAADRFQSLGAQVVDADLIAREVVEPGEPALEAIAHHFAPSILLDDGRLNRSKLREIIFSESAAKQWLEDLLHPIIRERIIHRLSERGGNTPYAILVSPLLLETDQSALVQRIIVVDCPTDMQLKRASLRDNTDTAQIKAIMATQLTREQRLARADDILHNDGDLEHLYQQIDRLHQHYTSTNT